MTERITDILERWQTARSNRGLWHQHWEDLARVMLTRRIGFVTETIEGDRRMENLYDGTAIQMAQALANTVGGMLRPEGQQWFFIKAVEDADEQTDEAKDWLTDTEDRMRKAQDDPRSRFRQAMGEKDLDLVVLGTAPLFIGEIVGQSRLIFQAISLQDAVPVYGEDGMLDAMFRTRRLTLRQAAKRWGKEKLSEASRQKIQDQKKLDEKVLFLFATMPRDEARAGSAFARNMPIADIVIEVDAKHEVLAGGFHEMPYTAPRWDTTSGEDYGRSPGMIALPDANTSQAIGETMLIAGQRSADPSILVPSDAFIDAPNTAPGGIAYFEADAVRDLGFDPFKLLEPGRNFPLTREIQNDVREQIRSAFLRDRFRLPPAGESIMTATEINARMQEFIQELGPTFGRLESDDTAPMIERQFNVQLRAGGFLPIPEVLQGRGIRFEYESPVKKIREQAEALAAREWVSNLAEFEEVKPGAIDTVNFDEYGRFTAQALGVPPSLVNGEQAVAALRTARAQAEEEAANMQAAQVAADAGSKVLNALPEGTIEGAA